MGVFVRSCEARRNIGSVEAFTKALLAAKSTAYNDPVSGAPGGLYPADLKPRHGTLIPAAPRRPWP